MLRTLFQIARLLANTDGLQLNDRPCEKSQVVSQHLDPARTEHRVLEDARILSTFDYNRNLANLCECTEEYASIRETGNSIISVFLVS